MAVRMTDQGLRLTGPRYLDVLAELHGRLRPRRYFEIGTLHGASLRLARGRSVAVDPYFHIPAGALRPGADVDLRAMTSDAFFAQNDLTDLLGGPVELAFLDGLHEFPALLRDFINTERACGAGSIIVLHDCVPLDAVMTGGAQEAAVGGRRMWTGDVWKLVPVLRSLRPDIDLTCLDAPPTGLAICRGLDPHSRVLADAYDAIVEAWGDVTLAAYGLERMLQTADVRSARRWLAALPRGATTTRARIWIERRGREAARARSFAGRLAGSVGGAIRQR